MSIRYMNWAWEQELPPVQKLVLLKLADNANDEGIAFPAIRTVAAYCSISLRTAQRVIQKLSDTGFIGIEKRFRGDGSQSSNRYRLRPDLGGDNLSRPSVATGNQEAGESPRGCQDNVIPRTTVDPSINQQTTCWFFPGAFSDEDRKNASRQLQNIPLEQAQLVLDELAGRMRLSEVREPLRYLQSLILSSRSGEFVPELAMREQKNRRLMYANKARLEDDSVSITSMETILHSLPSAMQSSLQSIKERIDRKK